MNRFDIGQSISSPCQPMNVDNSGQPQEQELAAGSLLLFTHQSRTLIEITGPDASDYIQRMTTNSIKNLKQIDSPKNPGQNDEVPLSCETRPTLFLKGDGRLVASGWIATPSSERIVLTVDAAVKDALLEHLDRFLIMEKAELRDISADW